MPPGTLQDNTDLFQPAPHEPVPPEASDTAVQSPNGFFFKNFVQNRHNFRVSVLDDVMRRIGQAMHFGLGPKFQKSIQESRRKTPIPHPPNQTNRTAAKLRQSVLNFCERRMARVRRSHGNIACEPQNCRPIPPAVVRGRQTRSNRRRQRLDHRRMQRGPNKQVKPLHAQFANDRNFARPNAQRTAWRPKSGRIHQHEPGKPLGAATAAPIPIPPPQSCATNVICRKSSFSMNSFRSATRRASRNGYSPADGFSDKPHPI